MVKCPHCQKLLTIDKEPVDLIFECPCCKSSFVLQRDHTKRFQFAAEQQKTKEFNAQLARSAAAARKTGQHKTDEFINSYCDSETKISAPAAALAETQQFSANVIPETEANFTADATEVFPAIDSSEQGFEETIPNDCRLCGNCSKIIARSADRCPFCDAVIRKDQTPLLWVGAVALAASLLAIPLNPPLFIVIDLTLAATVFAVYLLFIRQK